MLDKEVLSETPLLIPNITKAPWLGSVTPKAHQSINPLSVSWGFAHIYTGTSSFPSSSAPTKGAVLGALVESLLPNKLNLVLHPREDLLGKVTSRVFITEEYFSSAPRC